MKGGGVGGRRLPGRARFFRAATSCPYPRRGDARREKRANVRAVAHDAEYALDPDALEEAIRKDVSEGRQPCAVVATTGTTTSTALDPVAAIAAVARQYGLWLHVDAAMAGSAMILPECRWMWQGIEEADSLVLNAHKWLGAAFD